MFTVLQTVYLSVEQVNVQGEITRLLFVVVIVSLVWWGIYPPELNKHTNLNIGTFVRYRHSFNVIVNDVAVMKSNNSRPVYCI